MAKNTADSENKKNNAAPKSDNDSVNAVMPQKVASSDADAGLSIEKPLKNAKQDKPSFRATAEKSVNPKSGKAAKKGKDGKVKKNIFKRIFNGIKSIVSELKKVTWPKQKSVWSNTLIVLMVVVAFLIIIFIFDYVLSGLLSLLMGNGWVNLFG